eukprot:TRINITY_DN16576_c0_g1_i1.p1 TRINITY_DN16576_c0_g1~~TRINITY_DN16576_c0_g1_i1.p1  ORF type:complete len:543 (+),score=159.13 TRINITY_DN16576_c0_g1_i1:67-1629(+)
MLDVLEASRMSVDRPETVFGLVDGDMLGLLYKVGMLRGWDDGDLEAVVKKLLRIGVRSTFDLALLVKAGILTHRLRCAGEKVFSRGTLQQISACVGFGTAVTGLVGREASEILPSLRQTPASIEPTPPKSGPPSSSAVSFRCESPVLQGSPALSLRNMETAAPLERSGWNGWSFRAVAHGNARSQAEDDSKGCSTRNEGPEGNEMCLAAPTLVDHTVPPVPPELVLEASVALLHSLAAQRPSTNHDADPNVQQATLKVLEESLAQSLFRVPQMPAACGATPAPRQPRGSASGSGRRHPSSARKKSVAGNSLVVYEKRARRASRQIEGELQHICAGAACKPSSAAADVDAPIRDVHMLDELTGAAVWRVVEVPLSCLYFYQTTVAGHFGDGTSMQRTVDELRAGTSSPHTLPLMHALVIEGKFYGMGTRRLTCYHHVWGEGDPHRSIPVLFCNSRTTGYDYNHQGLAMKVIGFLTLDGRDQASVARRPRTGPPLTGAHLQQEYRKDHVPVARPGTNEVYFS